MDALRFEDGAIEGPVVAAAGRPLLEHHLGVGLGVAGRPAVDPGQVGQGAGVAAPSGGQTEMLYHVTRDRGTARPRVEPRAPPRDPGEVRKVARPLPARAAASRFALQASRPETTAVKRPETAAVKEEGEKPARSGVPGSPGSRERRTTARIPTGDTPVTPA